MMDGSQECFSKAQYTLAAYQSPSSIELRCAQSEQAAATSLSPIFTSSAPAPPIGTAIADLTILASPTSAHVANHTEGGAECGWANETCQRCGSTMTHAAFSRHKTHSCRFRRCKRSFQCQACFKSYSRLDALKRHWKGAGRRPGGCLPRAPALSTSSSSPGPGGGPHTYFPVVPQTLRASHSLELLPSPILPAPVAAQSTSTDCSASHHRIQPKIQPTPYDNHNDNTRCGAQCNIPAHQLTLKCGIQHPLGTQANYSQSAAEEQESIEGALLSAIIAQGFHDLIHERPAPGTSAHVSGEVYTSGRAATVPGSLHLPHAPQSAPGPLELQTALIRDPSLELSHGGTLEAHIGANAGFNTTDSWIMLYASSKDSPRGGIAWPPFGP